MPSFRCIICLDILDDASQPMSTLCGHTYCMECATFRFSMNPSCAVCRKPQSLDSMIRLYPDWETEETRKDALAAHPDDSLSSSPISVRSMDRAAEEAISVVKHALADRVEPGDAVMACNTFLNSVTDREKQHVNTELLREISFQLTLMSTKIQDDQARLEKLTKNAKTARTSEKRLTSQLEKQRVTIDALEKSKTQLSSQVHALNERIVTLEQQCRTTSEGAARDRFRTGKLNDKLDEVQKECEDWKKQGLRWKKKYLVLKAKVEESNRLAVETYRSHSRTREADSDDLIVVD